MLIGTGLSFGGSVEGVEARAFELDRAFEDFADRGVEARGCAFVYAIGFTQGMQLRTVQRFIHVDIAQSCQKGLIK